MAVATYSVQVAWQAGASNAFTLGLSTLGGTDIFVNQFTTSFAGTYDDVTAETRSVSIKRGRDDNLEAMGAGECTIVLKDTTGKFNPKNASSVLYGKLIPMRPVRVRATFSAVTYGLFYGFVRSIEHDPMARETRLACSDLFLWLSRVNPVIATVTPTTTGEAIGKVLDNLGWTDTAFRDLDTGDSITAGFSADGSATAIALIQALLETERGTFFIDGDGIATFANRNARSVTSSAATLTDVFADVTTGTDVDRVKNRARVTKTGSSTQEASDGDSVATYGWSDFPEIDSPYLNNDSQAMSLARWLVAQRKDPRPPLWGLELPANRTDALLTQALARELGDRVTISETSAGTSGDYFIEAVEHEITDGGNYHRTRWTLSERGTGEAFVIGASTLGGTDVLVY
jgi:hypothetical protein